MTIRYCASCQPWMNTLNLPTETDSDFVIHLQGCRWKDATAHISDARDERERCRSLICDWLDQTEVDHLTGPELDAAVRKVLDA